MSSGHRHAGEKAASALADQYYDRTAALVAACTVVDTYDCPWLANRSTDGEIVYRDKRVPRILKCGIDTNKTLPWHELGEKLAMDDGLPYDKGPPSAHNDVATPLERRTVEAQKPGDPDIWQKYTDELDGYIREVDDETIEHVPPDIDLRPFEDDDRKLLEEVIAAGADSEGEASTSSVRPRARSGKPSMPKILLPSDFARRAKAGETRDQIFLDATGARAAKLVGLQADVAAGGEDRSVDFAISTGAIDRYNSTISVKGWETANFDKNPVVLWAHDDSIPAIGRGESTRIEGGKLKSRAVFAERDVHPLADTIFRLIKAKFIAAASVGWIPLEWTFVEEEGRGFGIDYVRQELLEWSVVNIPANPECLVGARSMGIDTKPLLAWAERTLDQGGMLLIPRVELEALRQAAGAPAVSPPAVSTFPGRAFPIPSPSWRGVPTAAHSRRPFSCPEYQKMDKKLKELRQARATLVDQLEGLLGNKDAFEAKEKEIAAVEMQIAQAERAQQLAAKSATPHGDNQNGDQRNITVALDPYFESSLGGNRQIRKVPSFDHYLRKSRSLLREQGLQASFEGQNRFRSFGELLIAVAQHQMTAGIQSDGRLVRAPTGAGEIDPSAGGFLVQTDFSTAIFMRAYEMGEILGRVEKLSLSTSANSIKIPAIDETSRVTGSRWGGVQSYWLGEGVTANQTKPKFRLVELDLKKLMSIAYATDELLADASVLTSLFGKAFSEEIMFMTEDGIFEGTGAGQPLGIMNSPAKVAVAKEVGQASKTIVYENILKMWSRCWARSRQNAIWTINQDCEPQLYALSQVIGTAGVPVYLPANGISGRPYGTLFGKDVIPLEYSNTLGTEGDIALVDYSQYVLADKGGVQAASSMHVAFLTDEMVFRITYRVDGRPIWHAPLTPFKGSSTLTPFVTLATR